MEGTRFTQSFGIPNEEILVEIDEETIAATKLTVEDVSLPDPSERLRGTGRDLPIGGFTMPVSLAGDLDGIDQLRNIVLRGDADGRHLQLGDIASIGRGERLPREQSVYFRGRRAAVISARMDQSYSLNAWTERQRKVLAEFESLLPSELGIAVVFRQKDYTDHRTRAYTSAWPLGWGW